MTITLRNYQGTLVERTRATGGNIHQSLGGDFSVNPRRDSAGTDQSANMRKHESSALGFFISNMKICSKCGDMKSLTEFRQVRSSHRSDCKACERARYVEYAKQNSESIKTRMNAWRNEHKELLLEKRISRRAETNDASRAAYHADIEKSRARAIVNTRRYREKNRDIERIRNRERMRAAYREKYRSDPDYFHEANARRRAAHKSKMPPWADVFAIRLVYRQARAMRNAGDDCHVDHVVPLHSPLVCGLHVQNNLVIVSAFENRSKGNRHWPDMP
jgi:hypothetical protein